jgi:hypothetical protein
LKLNDLDIEHLMVKVLDPFLTDAEAEKDVK